jgi:putative salt-induced outer membrane protein
MALLLAAAGVATAQDAPKRPYTLQTDFGFVNTSGNTSTTTLNAGQTASYTTGAWTLAQHFGAVYGKTGGVKSAESYRAGVRVDYAMTRRLAAYGLGSWDRDQFAGISRRFQEGVGLSFKAVDAERTTLTLEGGVSEIQQRASTGVKDNFASGRGALLFKQMLGETAYFQQFGEVLPNLKTSKDVRINSETALVAPISKRVAFKAGYVVNFDNLPQPGFKKTDRYLTSGLQIVF